MTTGLISPIGIELHLTAGTIYWSDWGTDRIQSSNLDGSNVQNLVTSGLNLPIGVALGPSGMNQAPVAADDSYSVAEDTILNSNNDWFDSNWSHLRTLSFNNLAQSEDLTDFPVLLTLDSSRIDYTQTQNGGEDLRFVDGDGNVLAHEIEVWNESGSSYVWVKVPEIVGNSNTDFIWMYYGNPTATDGQDAAAVWSNSYQAVYHLSENPGGAGTVVDSAGNFDGTNQNTTDVAGFIGNAQEFDGVNQHIIMGANRAFLNNVSGTTISGWIFAHDNSVGAIMGISIAGGPTDDSRVTLNLDGAVQLSSISDDIEPFKDVHTASNAVTQNNWHYVVGVVDFAGDELTIYIDGVQAANLTSVGFASGGTPGGNSWRAVIGKNEDSLSRVFDGIMDELRLADTTRSADWAAAQYASMTDGFVGYGFEQSVAGVLANDTDVDGDPLSAVLVGGPSNGVLALNADGSFTYTPDPDFAGTDSFTYMANDGTVDSNVATVTITVTPVNDAPVAVDDGYSVAEDGTLTIAAAGVLANDTDVDGDLLSAVLVGGPSNGVLALNADGSFTYTPDPDFEGTDSFTYVANDGTVDSNVATVTITVTPVNDAPVAVDDGYSVAEDGTLTIAAAGVLANDTDVDGDPLSAVLVGGPSNGTLVLNADGSFTYTPDPDFRGHRQFHVCGQRRDSRFERGHGDDHGDAGQRRAGGR